MSRKLLWTLTLAQIIQQFKIADDLLIRQFGVEIIFQLLDPRLFMVIRDSYYTLSCKNFNLTAFT